MFFFLIITILTFFYRKQGPKTKKKIYFTFHHHIKQGKYHLVVHLRNTLNYPSIHFLSTLPILLVHTNTNNLVNEKNAQPGSTQKGPAMNISLKQAATFFPLGQFFVKHLQQNEKTHLMD